MTPNPTIHERVTQAITRDAELQVQLAELQAAVMMAKQAEDAVRKDPRPKESEAALAAERDRALAEAKALQEAAVARAQKPYDVAQARYQAALAEAQTSFAEVQNAALALYADKLKVVKQSCELAAAEARATVHRAEQEVISHRTTIDQHRRNIQEKLGINISNLLGV